MISFIGNRPVLQVGPYQVSDYDTAWLDAALRHAASKADHGDFPFIEEVCAGILQYLETKCPLKLIELDELYARLRKMLTKIGCQPIADQLEPVAPPVTLSLVRAALEAGNGFELAFFNMLGSDLTRLREAGASEVRITGVRRSVLILQGCQDWTPHCDRLAREVRTFISTWENGQPAGKRLRLVLEQAA